MLFLSEKYQCNNDNSIITYVCVLNIFKYSIWQSSSSLSLNIDNITTPQKKKLSKTNEGFFPPLLNSEIGNIALLHWKINNMLPASGCSKIIIKCPDSRIIKYTFDQCWHSQSAMHPLDTVFPYQCSAKHHSGFCEKSWKNT